MALSTPQTLDLRVCRKGQVQSATALHNALSELQAPDDGIERRRLDTQFSCGLGDGHTFIPSNDRHEFLVVFSDPPRGTDSDLQGVNRLANGVGLDARLRAG